MLPPSAAGRRAERILDDAALAEHAQVARERVGVAAASARPRRSPRRPRARRPRGSAARRRAGRCAARARRRAAAARAPRELVEVVHHQVDADAAGARRVDHPVVPGRRAARGAARSRASGRPSSPEATMLRSSTYSGQKRSTRPTTSSFAGALGGGDDRLGVLERQRDRLLEQHVLAGREGALGGLAMPGRRQADVDDVDVGRARAARRGRRVASAPHSAATRGGARARARRDGHDARTAGLRRPGAGVGLAHEAGADDRDADHPRPSAFRCVHARAIAASTSASGGHGSPWNSISTESGPA